MQFFLLKYMRVCALLYQAFIAAILIIRMLRIGRKL